MSSEKMKDPRYKMLQAELKALNTRIDALIETQKPKPFVLDLRTISKASSFDDTRVECIGADLIQISSDGNLGDISYKVLQLDGGTSDAMEAVESPHVLGPISALLITNDTDESGKNVHVARMQGSQAALAAIQHGTPQAIIIHKPFRMFTCAKRDYDGTADYFETDQALGDTPTLYMTAFQLANKIRIDQIRYQMTPTNDETYRLFLFRDAQADDQRNESNIIFDSGAGRVSGEIYNEVGAASNKVPVTDELETAGRIYYLLDWTGAPGDTTGYIKIYGEILD